jgi:ubiquinone/menaquinone biosynthesis C-methylase UbiE
MDRAVAVQPHDRVKNVPLSHFDSVALLRVLGLTDGSGAIRASRRGKYDQVNEFLRVVGDALGDVVPAGGDRPFTVVDCGCGKAYLTIALYHYLVHVVKIPSVRVIGVDRRADVVVSARDAAAQLDVADKVTFVEADLADFKIPDGGVDMVVSLHACDTATDEALAKGVEWRAKYVLAAPCCQHELQKALAFGCGAGDFAALLRQPILRERLCDLLTDAFRASIMRILGFRTQVVEFVSGEATARNIMLKCEYGVKPGQAAPIGEYLALRDFWKVTPWLETRLGDRFAKCLTRYE